MVRPYRPALNSHRTGRRTLAVALSTIAALAIAACSDMPDGRGPTPSTTAGAHATPTTAADVTGGSRSHADDATVAGSGADRPAVTDLDVTQLRGRGQQGTLSHIDRIGRRQIAVGAVQDADNDVHRPLILEAPASGGPWRRSRGVLPRQATDAAAANALRSPSGTPLVFGTRWDRDGADGVSWRRRENRWTPLVLSGDIAGPGDQIVDKVAAAAAGWVAIGTDDGTPAVWTSRRGRRWVEVDIPVDDDDVELVDTAVDATTMMLIAQTPDRSLVLRADNPGSGSFAMFRDVDRENATFTSVVPAPAGMAIGGGQMIDGRFSPHVWRVTGDVWPYAATAIPYGPITTNVGVTVDAMTVGTDGRLYATAAGAVVRVDKSGALTTIIDHGPDGTRSLMLLAPGRQRSRVEALSGTGRLWRLAGDGSRERTWMDATPDDVPAARRAVRLAGVAEHDGTWVVAGFIDDRRGRRAVTWVSTDGQRWTRGGSPLADEQPSDLLVGTSGDGLVLVGQRTDRLVVWISPDGASWTRLDSSVLEFPQGEYLQAESVHPTSDGFVIAGFHFTGTTIEPWAVSSRGNQLRAERLPPVEGKRDSITVGVCGAGRTLTVVGSWQRGASGPAWWTASDRSWAVDSATGAAAGGLDSCVRMGGRVIAVGSGGTIVQLTPRWDEIARLPRGHASGLVISRLGRRLVVSGNRVEGTEPRLWVSAGPRGESWVEVRPTGSDDPSNPSVASVAGTDDRLLVAVDDGVSGRLLMVRP